MSYLVLARKYRPQSFEDLVGQEHVARTLANAIAQDRVAHAFLFTGVRGVGKTTSARLLAKCLNCLGADGQAKGPTATPCQVCAACTEIAQGTDMDVLEIDGASYNGVDEVRRLQETLAFRPARDRFKVYIVDEVHMLSNAAWNAFLKTLEEPPPHVKFIFATTEVHKVPVTILSRCQRYDFKLIGAQVVAARLRDVLAKESITAEDGAVAILAREAAGSMRDAMSLLDQVIAFSGQSLTEADVARVLGVADRQALQDLAGALLAGDGAKALQLVARLAEQGMDVVHVTKDLLRTLRDLVVARATQGRDDVKLAELVDVAEEELQELAELAKARELDDLVRVHQGLSRAFDDVARSGQPRATLEVALVRLAGRPPLLPLDELLGRVGDLERRLATGAPPPQGPRGGGGGGARAGGGGGGAGGGGGGGAPVRGEASSGARASGGGVDGALALAARPGPELRVVGGFAEERAFAPPGSVPATVPSPAPPAREAARPSAPPSLRPSAPPPVAEPEWAAPPGLPDDAELAARSERAAASSRPSPEDEAPPVVVASPLLDALEPLVELVRARHAGVAAALAGGSPLAVGPDEVRLGYTDDDVNVTLLSDPEHLTMVTELVRAHFGASTTFAPEIGRVRTDVPTLAQRDAAKRRVAHLAARRAVADHPAVRAAVEILGAEVREIRLPKVED